MVRISANEVSMTLPVAFTRDNSSPMITAWSASVRTPCASNFSRSNMSRESRTNSTMACRPVLRPIQGNAPTSPAISQSRSVLNRSPTSSGLDLKRRVWSSFTNSMFSCWLMVELFSGLFDFEIAGQWGCRSNGEDFAIKGAHFRTESVINAFRVVEMLLGEGIFAGQGAEAEGSNQLSGFGLREE